MSAQAKLNRFLIIVLFSVSFFYGGYYYGKRGYEFEVKKNPPSVHVVNKSPSDQTIDFSLFWDVWALINSEHLNRPIDPKEMYYGAISGMVEAIGDPYTSFLPPEINKLVNNSLNSTYEGIGAELGMEDDQLIIIAPLDGSPAKESGLRAGDKILKINDESTIGITITEAVAKIRGGAGTEVTLNILHETDSDPVDIRITRGAIKIDSVTWEDKGEGTVYVRISRFGETTIKEWDTVVEDLNSEMTELDAVILDLRGNPGGYMLSAVHIAGEFFGGKTVTIHQSSIGEEANLDSKNRDGIFTNTPGLFILIDGGSASASEILAAAIKEHTGAVLIGETTLGKGTIQNVEDFSDGSSLHITTAKWLTPSGTWIHEVGIDPDITVDMTSEDFNEGRDPQLDKALELANEY